MPSVPEQVMLKVDRADNHIRNLASEILAFGKSSPYKTTPHRNPNSGRVDYVLTEVGKLPPELPTITGDAIQNLRTALDYMAYLLCVSRPGCRGDLVYFPIAESFEKYKSEALRKVKGMRQDAIDAISAIEPYGGGAGKTLWVLHALNKADKHRLLIPVLCNCTGIQIAPIFEALMRKAELPTGFPRPEFPKGLYLQPNRPLPMSVGQVLFSSEPNGEVNDVMNFRAEVSFNEPGIIEGEPLIPALQGMRDFVCNVISILAGLL